MLLSVRTLADYEVHATDGNIGRVEDVYFDDTTFTVRYVIAVTGWLERRRVLLPFAALRKIDIAVFDLHVALTTAQVAESPRIESDPPVSRQHEATLLRYYGFPYYWHGPAVNVDENWEGAGDSHLRSVRAITGYAVHAVDGVVGQMADVAVDDDGWQIEYLAVDTHTWWPGRTVLIPRGWIGTISWTSREVQVGLARETIRNAPACDLSWPVDPQQEQQLRKYYGAGLDGTASRP